MNRRIEEREAFEVFGVERIYKNGETSLVPRFWTEIQQNGEQKKLFDATKEVMPDRGEMPLRAVCGYRETDGGSFCYMICALRKPESKTNGYKIAQIPKAIWAVFRSEPLPHYGIAIPELLSHAYGEWLPSSGYDKATGPDMEIYGLDDGKCYEEVWIPVNKRRI
jgi:AraC family transcriptional regulator